MPARKPVAEWKHGTHGTYVNGCRCEACRAANAAYKRDLYRRTLTKSRAYFRARYQRRKAGRQAVGDADEALVRRECAYRAAVASAEGELAALIAEQSADDVPWVRPALYALPFDEARFADPSG